MASILDIQKKSQAYVANLNANIIRVIEKGNTLEYNKDQLLESKDAGDRPLIHKKTGSEYLSKAYAKKTGKRKPNLFRAGDFHGSMFLELKNEEYLIDSRDRKNKWLKENYGDQIFGISPKNQPKAKEENDKAVAEDYLKQVFQ